MRPRPGPRPRPLTRLDVVDLPPLNVTGWRQGRIRKEALLRKHAAVPLLLPLYPRQRVQRRKLDASDHGVELHTAFLRLWETFVRRS